jgi:hypothetical protein
MPFSHFPAIYRTARLSLLSGFAALLIACSTTQIMQPVVPPGDGVALMYFMREHYPPTFREVRIVGNGKTLATVAEKDYVAVNLPVGMNQVDIEASDGKPLHFQLPVTHSERMYVLLTGDVLKTGTEFTYREMIVHLNWHLRAYTLNRTEADLVAARFGKPLK